MKVIDLLNKIAKGEEVPKKIKYEGQIWLKQPSGDYVDSENSSRYLFDDYMCFMFETLNDEIEIIEEEKKIEKLDVALLGQCDNWLQKRDVNIKSDFELNPYIIDNIRENTLYFQRKINELIDEINKLKEN